MSLPIFTNLVFPTLASLFLVLCSSYFFSMRGDTGRASRKFGWFLLSFAVFLAGRPVQVLIGEHPLPLVVNSVRIFVLCAVTMPMLVMTAEIHKPGNIEIRQREVILLGVALGIVYVVFHALGTVGSYRMFDLGAHAAYASIMPQWAAPWYGREVSLGVQFLIGAILAAGSAVKCAYLLRVARSSGVQAWRPLILYVGVILFGASFAIGSLIRQWAVYYAGATVSALIVGIGVIVDVYNTSRVIENSGPFIREAILRHLSSPGEPGGGLVDALRLLGRSDRLDCFAVLSTQGAAGEVSDLATQGVLLETVQQFLARRMRAEEFLLLPLSANTLGVAYVSVVLNRDAAFGLFEAMAAQIGRGTQRRFSVGIGRAYGNATRLRDTYVEALLANEVAGRSDENLVIHVDGINPLAVRSPYPHREQDELLACVRLGETGTIVVRAATCFDGLKAFAAGNPAPLRLRLYALAGLVIDAAQTGGGDAGRIELLSADAYRAMEAANDMNSMRSACISMSLQAAEIVADAQGKLARGVFVRAREFMAANYAETLTQEAVAREVALSPSYFAHLFKKEAGKSFLKYLTDLRLTAARQLLLTSTRSITEIAQAVGYNDSNYFSTVFRNSEGVSPSEYRRVNRR